MAQPIPADTVVLDIDGTLVDSNYFHTVAWVRAFSECNSSRPTQATSWPPCRTCC